MDFEQVKKDLISEIHLTNLQADVFLLIVAEGKMSTEKIANKLKIPIEEALTISKSLVELGGFIDFAKSEFETMHPRFSAVNMYRRMCERNNEKFSRNVTVDNIGVALEKPYEDARTK